MIRNWYNQIPHPALKIKREITKYINWQQFTKGTRSKPNEQLFPRQVIIQLPNLHVNTTYGFSEVGCFLGAPISYCSTAEYIAEMLLFFSESCYGIKIISRTQIIVINRQIRI